MSIGHPSCFPRYPSARRIPTRPLRQAVVLAAASIAVLATSASASVPIDLGAGSSFQSPHLTIDGAGTGYLTWVETVSGNDVLHFCSLPTGGTACRQSHSFSYDPGPDFGSDAGNSPALTADGRLLVLDSRCCGASSDKKFLYTSTNGGQTFTPSAPTSPPTGEVGQNVSGASGSVLYAPAGTLAPAERILTVDTGPITLGGDFQATGTTGLTTARFGLNPGAASTYTESLALQGSTLVAAYTDLGTEIVKWRKYNGGGADLNSETSWSVPQAIAVANIDSNAQVVGGPGGIYVVYNTGSPGFGHVVLQKFTGSSWGLPVTLTDFPVGSNFALAEDTAGVLHFAWRDSAGALRYRYARDASNTDFTRPQTLVTSGNFFDPHLAVDAAGNGWLSYHDGSPNHGFAIPVAPDLAQHTLTVAKSGTGTGTVTSTPPGIDCGTTCSAAFDSGLGIGLSATPAPGSSFARWTGGGCTGTATCAVTLSADTAVTATFSAAIAGPPNTKITKTKVNAKRRTTTFEFKAIGTSSGFQCLLQKPKRRHHKPPKLKFRTCRSPKPYKRLKPGRYTFEVRAVSPAGPDPTPAKKNFTVK
jgi:hypothetical protein